MLAWIQQRGFCDSCALIGHSCSSAALAGLQLTVQEGEKEGQQLGTGHAAAILSSFLTLRVGDAAQGALPSSETTGNLESGNPPGAQQQCSGPI